MVDPAYITYPWAFFSWRVYSQCLQSTSSSFLSRMFHLCLLLSMLFPIPAYSRHNQSTRPWAQRPKLPGSLIWLQLTASVKELDFLTILAFFPIDGYHSASISITERIVCLLKVCMCVVELHAWVHLWHKELQGHLPSLLDQCKPKPRLTLNNANENQIMLPKRECYYSMWIRMGSVALLFLGLTERWCLQHRTKTK